MGAAEVALIDQLRRTVKRFRRDTRRALATFDERTLSLMSDNEAILERVARLEQIVTSVQNAIGEFRSEVARLREETDLTDELNALDGVIDRLDAAVAPTAQPEPEPEPESGEVTDVTDAPVEEAPVDGEPGEQVDAGSGEPAVEAPGDVLSGSGEGETLPPIEPQPDTEPIPVDLADDDPGQPA